MSQIYDAAGKVIPVTLVAVKNNVVTQVRTKETDGYEAVQIGEGEQKPARINKPLRGHIKELGSFSSLKEFRVEAPAMKVGDKIGVDQFKAGDVVVVSAVSKGKGFQGVVKRHGFGGGPRSHGQKHSEREPGSIGGGLRTRVPVGTRMAGRMGSDRITVKNLKIVHVDPSESLLYIGGALPGRRGTLVEIVG